jgi:diguanylate cyclase (GGDEF)-like protein/PAS domain S-box-containing protein
MVGFSQSELEQALIRCEAEPIHQIGQIQPHGALLVLSADSQRLVLQASNNLAEFIDLPEGELPGTSLDKLLGIAPAAQVEKLIYTLTGQQAATGHISAQCGATQFSLAIRVFAAKGAIVLELIPDEDEHQGERLANLLLPMQQALLQSEGETDTYRYFDQIASITRELLGFDRVMVYRFDGNWDGEVIAESRIASANSYMGNRFPSSDIPPQARRLYTQNLVRIISDVAALPVDISPALNADGTPLDLTHSALRSFSPVHVEYLRNMGVCASMSVSLLQNGRLWGLIACHHFTPKRVSNALQNATTFISRMVSSKLTLIECNEQRHLEIKASQIVGDLLKYITTDVEDEVLQRLLPDVLTLLDASGVIMSVEGKHYVHGEVPAAEAIADLLNWLSSQPVQEVFSCDNLNHRFADSSAYATVAAGLLASPISSGMRNCIVWLRPEKLRTVQWAGNPEKIIHTDPGNRLRLSPRVSFESWTETWKGRCNPWSHPEIEAAVVLARALTEGIAQMSRLEKEIAGHRLAKKNLQDNEIKLATILDGVEAFIYIKDPEYRYQYANRRVCELFGRPMPEVIGCDDTDFFDQETALNLRKNDQRVIDQGERVYEEEVNTSTDGSITSAYLSIKIPLRTTDGTIYALCGISTDITARKEAELRLANSEAQYRTLADSGQALIWTAGTDKLCNYFNKVWLEFTGRTLAQELGNGWAEGVHPDDLQRCIEIYSAAFDRREKFSMDYRLKNCHGDYRWIEDQGCPRFDATGEFIGYIGYCLDISDRKKDEAFLLKLSLAVEQSPASLVITDLEGNIEYVNKTFSTVTGYDLNEVLGKNPRVLKSGKTPTATYVEMWNQLTHGHAWKGEFINRSKFGREYIESVVISPVRQADGRITNYLAVKQDITEQKRVAERVENLAHFDQLTGLPNRALLNERFSFALSRAQRNKEKIAVMFLDLDRFKNINDTLGHSIGDQLLLEIAFRIKASIRDQDTVSRLGGDDFILVLPDIDADGATHVAGKLIAEISKPCHIENHELVSTPSIGIVIYPDDGTDFETLSKNADTAMYQAKIAGRNGYRFFTAEMQAHSARTLQVANALRYALARNELQLYYQPQIAIQDGTVVGAEALLRWNHPLMGFVSPAEFIPIAEESGLIIPIGEWVLRTAAKQMKTWLDSGMQLKMMAVNLSSVQFRQEDIAETITRILEEAKLPQQHLELELTEAAAMSDPQTAIAVMDKLGEHGIRMAIDDFGTGYSSLSYLKKFNVYKLKIDQSFVRDITDDPEDKAIVAAIINMASSLGIRTIAEGVETSSQLAFLRLQGCDEVQGYFFSKPLPSAQFEAFVRLN